MGKERGGGGGSVEETRSQDEGHGHSAIEHLFLLFYIVPLYFFTTFTLTAIPIHCNEHVLVTIENP